MVGRIGLGCTPWRGVRDAVQDVFEDWWIWPPFRKLLFDQGRDAVQDEWPQEKPGSASWGSSRATGG